MLLQIYMYSAFFTNPNEKVDMRELYCAKIINSNYLIETRTVWLWGKWKKYLTFTVGNNN